MNFAIVSCSLAANSRSRVLARCAANVLAGLGHEHTFIDLRETQLEPFDNEHAFESPAFAMMHRAIDQCDGVIVASPIYNWGLASTAKALIEVTGATGQDGRTAAWFDKVVTFVCSGGLPHSYMAYGPVAVSMMLDFKCIVNPYMVYATDRDFGDGLALGDKLHARLERTLAVKVELASALAGRSYRSTWEV